MKKAFVILMVCVLAVSAVVILPGCKKQDKYAEYEKIDTPYKGSTLYVYNWGEYISNGEDDSLNLLEVFEYIYDIKLVHTYTTYSSNEEMYAKISSGTTSYDVIIPSDYMISRLIEEDLIQKINYDNIPNYKNIADVYKTNMYYDMGGEGGRSEYSVPYTIGLIGIIYDTKHIDEEDVANRSWDLLWNKKYTGKLLTFDNSRDAFGVAMFKEGLDVNSTDPDVWNKAYESLMEQKPVLKAYVMDDVFDEMEGGNAYAATYYAGDCLNMMANNEDLDFYYPKEGSNLFFDAMCIPKNAKNVGAAELFINFMLEEEFAIENSLYICYQSPNTAVFESDYYKEELGEDAYSLLYDVPEEYKSEDGSFDTNVARFYYNLDADTKALLSDLWSRVK